MFPKGIKTNVKTKCKNKMGPKNLKITLTHNNRVLYAKILFLKTGKNSEPAPLNANIPLGIDV